MPTRNTPGPEMVGVNPHDIRMSFEKEAQRTYCNVLDVDVVALRYAVLAATFKSFSRAAAHVGVKQSTLSKRIKTLEARLALPLFERSTRGALTTTGGQRVLDTVELILADLDAVYARAQALGAGRIATLGLGFSTSLAGSTMRILISEMMQRYPALHLELVEGDRERLMKALNARLVDFAVLMGEVEQAGLEHRFLWSERVMIALPEKHPLAQKQRIYWQDLRTYRLVLPRRDPGPELADLAYTRLTEPGWKPNIQTQELGRDSIVHLIGLGEHLTLTTDAAAMQMPTGVLLRPIHEFSGNVSQITYGGYWRGDNPSTGLTRLLELLQDQPFWRPATDGGV